VLWALRASETTLRAQFANNIHCLRLAIKSQTSMQLPTNPTNDNPAPTLPSQPLEDASTLRLFQPFKPPLRERKLKQTTLRVVLFLLTGIACAAVTVWWFLPSQLPWLP
jgi:hypothetical protein